MNSIIYAITNAVFQKSESKHDKEGRAERAYILSGLSHNFASKTMNVTYFVNNECLAPLLLPAAWSSK